MRLTLRTLLAWLDGVLTPDEQRRLGERVAGSTVATHMAERIRAAIGRTMIGAPRVEAKGMADDPNSVAEYLDNSLPSERLEPFERICIESEVHLAEVAACHGMLAEVARHVAAPDRTLGDEERHHLQDRVQRRLVWDRERLAAEIAARANDAAASREASLREQRETARAIRAALGNGPMEADVPHAQSAADRAAANGADGNVGRGGPRVDDGDVATIDPSRGGGHPVAVGPRRSSLSAWLSAALALGLLLALGGVLTWSLVKSRGRAGRDVAAAQGQSAARGDAALVVEPVAAPAGPAEPAGAVETEPSPKDVATPTPPPATEPAAATVPPSVVPVPPATVPPADAAAPPVEPAAGPVRAGQPANAANTGPAPALAEQTAAVPPPPNAASPAGPAIPPTAAAAVPAVADPAMPPAAIVATPSTQPAPGAAAALLAADAAGVGFVGGEGVLLRRDDAATADAWTYLPPNSKLNAREDLLVPPGFQPELHVRGVTIRLLPSTRAVLSLDPDGTPRIEVVFGRAVARASRPDARLGITAGGLVGTIEAGLTEPVAVQVELKRFAGVEPGEAAPRARADIVAASRGIAWRQTGLDGGPAAAPLEGIDAQGMLPAGSALAWDSIAPARATVAREPVPPTWADAGVRPDRLEKSACDALSAKVAATAPLTRALRELSLDKRAENRMLAAATLALVGEYDELVELLCADSPGRKLEPRQWTTLEASTVPLALARGGAAAASLRKAFEDHGPNGKAEALWMMACGLSDAQIFAGDDKLLVEKLEDPSLVVRRYASKCLVDIVQPSAADRLRYRPDAPPDLRRDGVYWWRLQAEKGLIRRPDAGTTGAGGFGSRGGAD
jgi:hypothetical protein